MKPLACIKYNEAECNEIHRRLVDRRKKLSKLRETYMMDSNGYVLCPSFYGSSHEFNLRMNILYNYGFGFISNIVAFVGYGPTADQQACDFVDYCYELLELQGLIEELEDYEEKTELEHFLLKEVYKLSEIFQDLQFIAGRKYFNGLPELTDRAFVHDFLYEGRQKVMEYMQSANGAIE